MASLPINFITIDPDDVSANELAKLIKEQLRKDQINTRICQNNDTVGSVCLGLLTKAVDSIWNSGITVMYAGTSTAIQHQKKDNPNGELSKADLIFPKQYIFLNQNQKILVVCEDKNLISKLYSCEKQTLEETLCEKN